VKPSDRARMGKLERAIPAAGRWVVAPHSFEDPPTMTWVPDGQPMPHAIPLEDPGFPAGDQKPPLPFQETHL
jgi:hypothetical protein